MLVRVVPFRLKLRISAYTAAWRMVKSTALYPGTPLRQVELHAGDLVGPMLDVLCFPSGKPFGRRAGRLDGPPLPVLFLDQAAEGLEAFRDRAAIQARSSGNATDRLGSAEAITVGEVGKDESLVQAKRVLPSFRG